MNSYILDHKEKTEFNKSHPIEFIEHYMFKDEISLEKFIIINVKNRTAEVLQQITIDVTEMDEDFEIIGHKQYQFNEINIAASGQKMILEKISINQHSTVVYVDVVSTKSNDVIWTNEHLEVFDQDENEGFLNANMLSHHKVSFPFLIPILLTVIFMITIVFIFKVLHP